MAEDMEMSSSYDEAEYEEYAEEAEARIEPFRRRRKPYRLWAMCSIVFFADTNSQEEKKAQASSEPGLLQRRLH